MSEMNDRFLAVALPWILRVEGGYVCDPDDPGGATKYGISQRSFPDLKIEDLTENDAKQIYWFEYWVASRCGMLPPGLDVILFDGSVLMGADQATRQLQRGLGVADDGVIGPVTRRGAEERGLSVVPKILAERVVYLASLKAWKTFGRGWSVRTFQLQALATS